MSRKKFLIIVGLIALVAVIGFGAFTYYTARAQSTTSHPAWGGNRPFAGRMGKGAGFGVGEEALAQALGISLEELQSAQQKAAKAALKQAVEQGLITEKQAEWFQTDSRRLPFGNRLFAWLNQNGIDLNALRYTSPGGTIWLRATQDAGQVLLQVSDNGAGIAAQDLPRIFDRFYRADPARSPNGQSGLGLAIAKSLIELQGGNIVVQSAQGKGTTFTITFPKEQAKPG